MSLIHDALKKAEQEKKPDETPKNFLNNPIIPDRLKSAKPKPILFILLGLSLLLLVYFRLIHKPANPSSVPSPKGAIGDLNGLENPLILKKTAMKLFEEGKYSQSLSTWERLTLLTPTDAEIYNNMGLTLRKLGRKEEAYQAYTKALALQESYPETHNNLGVLYLNDGEKEKAKIHFQEAANLNKNYPEPYLNLAVILEQEGNFKQALNNYQKFLELSPETEKELKEKIERKMDLLAK